MGSTSHQPASAPVAAVSAVCGALLLLAATACDGTFFADDVIVAKVGDATLTLAAFEELYASYEAIVTAELGAPGKAGIDSRRRFFLQDWALRQLFEEEGRRLGLVPSDADVRRAERGIRRMFLPGEYQRVLAERNIDGAIAGRRLAEDLAAIKVIAARISVPQVDESEIAAYYEENRQQFERPAEVDVQHMILTSEETAKDIARRLAKGEPFAQLALAYGQPGSLSLGLEGGIYSLAARDLPAPLQAEIAHLRDGEVSAPVPLDEEFHVLRLVARRPAGLYELAEVRTVIATSLGRKRLAQAYATLVVELRQRANPYELYYDRIPLLEERDQKDLEVP
ncbi:MAG: peptidyl-prolyl cis-trans isomerase [Candidatus Schekmanbacteria bacterium]|nr:peptidyl-prolyl cis-trans isomerase [Candidatus Schekmanbacteria bacterium]